jgi:hypothetical protein
MFSRWIVTNVTSASVTTFLTFLAGIISWSVYCTSTFSVHKTRVVLVRFKVLTAMNMKIAAFWDAA